VAIVVDAAQASGMGSSVVRKRAAESLKERSALLAAHCPAYAFVLTSMVTRGVLTAVNWAVPPPCPQKTFGTRAEAVAWCRRQLAGVRRSEVA
jgi:hypothetical protein